MFTAPSSALGEPAPSTTAPITQCVRFRNIGVRTGESWNASAPTASGILTLTARGPTIRTSGFTAATAAALKASPVTDDTTVPPQTAQPSENSTETALNARRRRNPIGTVHNDIPARLRAHMVPCGLPGEPACLWCAAADQIEQQRIQIATLIKQRDHALNTSLMWEQHARNPNS